MRRNWFHDEFFEPSVPREAKGGIKARSQRGQFGESWWSKRWLAVLESFNLGTRLTRGRAYARKGQVLNITIDAGAVKADVQGSRPSPYQVKIGVKTLSAEQWSQVAAALGDHPALAAELLAGEMPQGIEEVFSAAGMSLFPAAASDLTTDCSCPDWSNPCKHVAAVYYLLGEEFDRDPFLIFALRGITREQFVGQLSGAGSQEQEDAKDAEMPPVPLSIEAFWTGPEAIPGVGEVLRPPVTAPLLRRLGAFPFWRGAVSLEESLEPVYRRASGYAEELLAGDVSARVK